jgi:hypothetical protein
MAVDSDKTYAEIASFPPITAPIGLARILLTGWETNRIEEINTQKKKSLENAKTPQQRYKLLHGLMKIHFLNVL